MIRDNNRLYELTDTNSPAETLAEMKNILFLVNPSLDPSPIEKIYEDIIRLFNGEFSGYKASNTKYHNLEHTSSTALAAARLVITSYSIHYTKLYEGVSSALPGSHEPLSGKFTLYGRLSQYQRKKPKGYPADDH